MKIGIFTDRYLPQTDGVSRTTETYRVELEKLGHEVYIFAPRPSWRYHEPSPRIHRFASVKGLFFEDYLTTFYFPPQAMRKIDKLNLDIIHYQTPGQMGLLGVYYAIQSHLPLVTTYHTDLFEYVKLYPGTLPGTIALSMLTPIITNDGISQYRQALSSMKPERNLNKWHQRVLVNSITPVHNHCNLIITPSKKYENQLKSWGTTSQIVTLPNGVDKISTTSQKIDLWRSKLKIAEDDKIIIFVGRLGLEKNISLLIRAFNTVARREPHTKLLLVGPGEGLNTYKDQAAESPYADRIIFTGRIDWEELGALYELSTVFAFPSLTDTQGIVMNEAAWAGLPIVMIDKDITDVIVDGENGYVASNSSRDFAAKLLKILSSPKLQEQFGRRSVELTAETSAAKQAAKLSELYHKTIDGYISPKSQPKTTKSIAK